MKRKFLSILIVIMLAVSISACSKNSDSTSGNDNIVTTVDTSSDVVIDKDSVDTFINFNNNSINVEGDGTTVDGSTVTINSGGTYCLQGTLDDGQVIVNSADEENVYLLLAETNITCSDNAPIYVVKAKNTILTLAEGSVNYITDGTEYKLEDANSNEPNAAIYSKDDLTINGKGSLIVNGNYNNGITSKDDLKITGGNITVNATHDGIRGKDSVKIKDGTIIVNAKGDGIKANNSTDSEKGYVLMENGTVEITADEDGIQAEGDGIDANGSVYIKDGVVVVNGPEDNGNGALDYDGTFEISGGTLIAAGSTGMAQSPSTTSSQGAINVMLPSQTEDTIVSVQSESGNEIVTFKPSKKYQSVIVSTPDIKNGSKYIVSYGGSTSSDNKDGLYTNGSYSGGTQLSSFTLSSNVMTVSKNGASVGGNGMNGGGMPQGGRR